MISGPDRTEEDGIGFEHSPQGTGGGDNTLNGAANTHQVFNNIILLTFLAGTKRYDPVVTNPNAQYSDNFRNRSDFLGSKNNRYSAAHSNELMDYNLYWRPAAMNTDPAFKWMLRGAGQTLRTFNTLDDWYVHAEFGHSKLSGQRRAAYPDGWEGNSTMTKPTIGSIDNYPAERFNYRPAPTSAVTVATSSSLSGVNWWSNLGPTWGRTYFPWTGLAPDGWKGPLDPNGSTMTVGVQNP